MLRREQGITDKASALCRDDSLQGTKQNHLKISTLAPYFTEIEVIHPHPASQKTTLTNATLKKNHPRKLIQVFPHQGEECHLSSEGIADQGQGILPQKN